MILDGAVGIFVFNCDYKSLDCLHRWHVIVFSLVLRIFDVVHKRAQLATMCFQLSRSFRDDERADTPSRCSFIPTAETNFGAASLKIKFRQNEPQVREILSYKTNECELIFSGWSQRCAAMVTLPW